MIKEPNAKDPKWYLKFEAIKIQTALNSQHYSIHRFYKATKIDELIDWLFGALCRFGSISAI